MHRPMNRNTLHSGNLYVIGYRCTGKTSIGRALAHRLRRPFVDCDQAVTDAAGRSIRDIVAAEGWHGFRCREHRIIDALSRRSGLVVATGGGVVLDPVNVTRMRRTGIVLWLTATVDTIRERIRQDPDSVELRPSLSGRPPDDEIEPILQQRLPAYCRAADIRVSTDGRAMAAIADDAAVRLSMLTARRNPKRRKRPCRALSGPCSK